MKRLIGLVLFCATFAHAQTTTPNLGLYVPYQGQTNWATAINGNWSIIDSTVGALQAQYQGAWSSSISYFKGQIVTDNSIVYQSTVNLNLGNVPSSGSQFWIVLPYGSGTFAYPGNGVPCSTGSSWCSSYTVGTGNNDLVQLTSAGALPAVSGANLTNLPAGSPPGSNMQVPFNNSGVFGASSAFTFNPSTAALGLSAQTGSASATGTGVAYTSFAPPNAAPTATLVSSAGNCTPGAHDFTVSFITANGETQGGPVSNSVTCSSGSGQISLTGIPLGPAGTIARNVYASSAGNGTMCLPSASPVINDNTTTTYTFNTADSALECSWHPYWNSTSATVTGDANTMANINVPVTISPKNPYSYVDYVFRVTSGPNTASPTWGNGTQDAGIEDIVYPGSAAGSPFIDFKTVGQNLFRCGASVPMALFTGTGQGFSGEAAQCGTGSAMSLQFEAEENQAVWIDKGGNVRIGPSLTTTPPALLTVGNNDQFQVSSYGGLQTSGTTWSSISVTCSGCSPSVAGTYVVQPASYENYPLYYNGTDYIWFNGQGEWRIGTIPGSGWYLPSWYIASTASIPPYSSSWTAEDGATGSPTTALGTNAPVTVACSGCTPPYAGSYVQAGTYNSAPYYTYSSYFVWYNSAGDDWVVSGALGSLTNEFFIASTASVPPISNFWIPANGAVGQLSTLPTANYTLGGGINASSIIDQGIAAGTSPICPNGPGGQFTTSGCAGGGSSGTVMSVAMTMPGAIFSTSVSGSPITTSGTLAPSLLTQSANTVFAGPPTGSAATPTFRALVSADIPNNAANTTGNAATATALAATPSQCSGSQFATGIAANGNANCSTPSGLGVTLQTNGTNNSSQSALNIENSTANAAGFSVTMSNPSSGNVKAEVGVSSQSTALTALGAAAAVGADTAIPSSSTLVCGQVYTGTSSSVSDTLPTLPSSGSCLGQIKPLPSDTTDTVTLTYGSAAINCVGNVASAGTGVSTCTAHAGSLITYSANATTWTVTAWPTVSSGGSGFSGTVTYTSSQTASTSDNGKLVIMNCSAACSYTLPATQPSTTWQAWVMTVGSTNAAIVLGGSDTFNGSTSVPVLDQFKTMFVAANTGTSTDYRGDAPLAAGSGISLTYASNSATITGQSPLSSASSVSSRNTAITTAVHFLEFNGASKQTNILEFNAWDSAAGVGCTGNTTVTWSVSYTDQLGNIVAITIPETIVNNGNVSTDTVSQIYEIPANTSTSTGIYYTTTYTAGSGCTTDPSYAAALNVIYP